MKRTLGALFGALLLAQCLVGVAAQDGTDVVTDPADAARGGDPALAGLVPRTWEGRRYGCKCYFGDACWPKAPAWNALNTTVGGNLAVYVPPESPCYNYFNGTLGTVPTYDAAKCASVTAIYSNEQWNTDQSQTLLWRYWSNSSCVPTTNPTATCGPGYYGVYVLSASTRAHIKAGVDFARRYSLRLVVRNTGHDFVGRSNGWGSLVINTHAMQDVEFIKNWKGGPGGYKGGAVTVGAGVQGRALLRKAIAQNPPLTVVVGECPTVGPAGGYVQGGGHGPLTPLYGWAADNALSFDIVTASGEYVTADAQRNPGLFWALKGGGPSTYGVVVSATFKTFPEQRAAGATMYINATQPGLTEALFWEGVRIFHGYANTMVDHGFYVLFTVSAMSLRVRPLVAPGQTAEQMEAVLAPLRANLTAAGVPFALSAARDYATYFDLYIDLFEDESGGNPNLMGGWMFSREDVAANNSAIIDAFKLGVSPRPDLANKGYMVGHLWNAGHGLPPSEFGASATNPRFRSSSDLILYTMPVGVGATLAQKADIQGVIDSLDRAFSSAGPTGAAYINEANPLQSNWQDLFWGPTVYPKLKNTRKLWDPKGVFYAVSTPGTEDWEVIEYGTRLCKRL